MEYFMNKAIEAEDFLAKNPENDKSLQVSFQFYIQKTLEFEKKIADFSYKIESFENNNAKTRFFTGLHTFSTLNVLYKRLQSITKDITRLNLFQKFILTLMKLRLAPSFRDLAYRFNISEATASSYFHEMLFLMYQKFESFIVWPTRENLRKTMPESFKRKYKNKVAVIIDCFEVFTERPASLDGSSQLYSHYKHHHTIKVLIGIIPQGAISFISKAYGGKCSDKFVTMDSKILDNLEVGDVVMADRGFLVEDEILLRQCNLVMPSFTKGQSQLHPLDIEESREISNLRIHVERVIGSLRQKYTILNSTIPISMLTKYQSFTNVLVIDQIVTVCSALTNMCPSMVVKRNVDDLVPKIDT